MYLPAYGKFYAIVRLDHLLSETCYESIAAVDSDISRPDP